VIAEMHYYRNLLARAFQDWHKRRKKEEHRFRDARLARRWFIKRQCWRRWLVAMDGRALQRKLHYWNLAKTRDYLEGETSLPALPRRVHSAPILVVWRNHAVRRRKDEALVEYVQSHQIQVSTRIQLFLSSYCDMATAYTGWRIGHVEAPDN
jgi:hypothetical protein